MLDSAALATSFTAVLPAVTKQPSSKLINDDDFADADVHFILKDRSLAEALARFAMSDLAIAKANVGSKETHSTVEFFSLDLKKNKKEIGKLFKLVATRWLQSLQSVELLRQEADGNLFSADLTDAVDLVVEIAALRRFLMNATDPTMLSKKKRTVLLFHHTAENAPRPG